MNTREDTMPRCILYQNNNNLELQETKREKCKHMNNLKEGEFSSFFFFFDFYLEDTATTGFFFYYKTDI